MFNIQYTPRFWLASIGLVQGIVFWAVHKLWRDDPRVAAMLATLVACVAVWGLLLQLSWTRKYKLRLLPISIAGLFGLVTLWVWWQIPGKGVLFLGDDFRAFTLVTASLISLYALLPFLQIFQESGRLHFPYPELFRHSWSNFFIVSVGALFVAVFGGLIVLWVFLFKLVGISFFEDLFFSFGFVSVAMATAFGFGIALGKEGDIIIYTLRRITLIVFQLLMPLLVFIALLFLAALPFTGLQPLWDTKTASPLLLSVLGLVILFVNAVVQDGSVPSPYPNWMKHGVETLLLAAPIFSVLTLYAIGLRISQYGLTPDRCYVVLFALIMGLYAAGYAIAVIKRGETWLNWIRPINIGMSFVVAILGLLVHTPVLDPLAWSARNQYQRLVKGRTEAERFDYGALRFQLGRAGYERLLAIEKLANHPKLEIMRARVEEVRRAASYYEWQEARSNSETAEYVKIFSSSDVPQDLIPTLFRGASFYEKQNCMKNKDCALFSVNLDSDSELEYVLITSGSFYRILLYDRDEHRRWRNIGEYKSGNDRQLAREAVIGQFQQSITATAKPAYLDLKVGDSVFQLHRR